MAWTALRTWVAAETVTASHLNEQIRDNLAILKTTIDDSGHITLTAGADLTISSGAITVTDPLHKVDTEASAATDDLDTINSGTNVGEGFVLFLRSTNAGRVITARNLGGGGNIIAHDSSNYAFQTIFDAVRFIQLGGGGQWYMHGN